MALIVDKQFFYVDSHNRKTGTDSDFSYYLDIQGDFDYGIVLQASIPKSYYLVQLGFNTFILNENGNQTVVTLPIGNYSRSSFRAQLQTSLNASSFHAWVYLVSIPNTAITADTGLYTYSVSGNGGIQPSFIIGVNLFEQLGFNANTTYNFVANTLVSVNVVKFQLEDTIYLNSDIIADKDNSVLQEIFAIDNPDFSNILWLCPDPEAYSKKIIACKNICRFWITNEDYIPLPLNGQNVVFTLLLYKKEMVYSLLRNMIKLELLKE